MGSCLSPFLAFISSNFRRKSERLGRLSLILWSSDFELSLSRRSMTRCLRWGLTQESSTLFALDSSMIERRSSLESCTWSIVCDFRLSLFLKSFDFSGPPFSLGRLLECLCELRTLLSSSSSEEELGRARMTWTRRRL
ncbi:hypothetical protein F2Q69_00059779 [Brassica cretica]|uniref:Uncharacterized protein n=1 Tax=Brassica cretica TaxID=69181 RepID=A0A8S9RIY9_BRACR|nr:hypothetical protein F2Q69_00059779 [Brassica cretica]